MNVNYDQIIFNTAIKYGFTPTAARLVVAQARYESSDYTSRVFLANNNTSGMKYIGQPLATRGTLAPKNEQRCNGGCNSDYYAKFDSLVDSATDKIGRNYNLTIKGVTPNQLKNAQSPEQFAELLKKRGYYGGAESNYAGGLKAKLMKISIVDFVDKTKNNVGWGASIILLIVVYYFYAIK